MKLLDALKMDKTDIQAVRLQTILEDAKVAYSRMAEDFGAAIKKKKMQRANMLDLSGLNQGELIKGREFSGAQFAQEDARLTGEIDDLERSLKLLEARVSELF